MNLKDLQKKYQIRFDEALDKLAEVTVEMTKAILEDRDGAIDKKGRLTKKALNTLFAANTDAMASALNRANDTEYDLKLEVDCGCDCDGSCEDEEDEDEEDDFNEVATKFSDTIIRHSQKLLRQDEDYELDEHELFVSFTSAIRVLEKSLNDSNGTDYDLIGKGTKDALDRHSKKSK